MFPRAMVFAALVVSTCAQRGHGDLMKKTFWPQFRGLLSIPHSHEDGYMRPNLDLHCSIENAKMGSLTSMFE